jgi:hypothetical protein
MFEHERAIKDEAESGEVRKNRVRESDCRNCSELKYQRYSISNGRWTCQNGLGLTRGSLLYQKMIRDTTRNDATRNDGLRLESSTMLMLGSTG